MLVRLGGLIGLPTPDDPVEKVTQSVFGREHLVDMSIFSKSADVPLAVMPGLQAFGTARGMAMVMRALANGSMLSKPTMKDMLTSRQCRREDSVPTGGGGLPVELGHLLKLEGFDEWGLGMQLLNHDMWNAGQDRAWGHLSQSGSAALVLPGDQPKAMALLLNMIDGESPLRVCKAVLKLLGQHLS